MIYRPIIIALSAVFLIGGCSKKKPTVQAQPAETEEALPPPDSILGIGKESADLVGMWVLALSVVETEKAATTASNQLDIIAGQFDALLERAEKLPKLNSADFKRIDTEIDTLISGAAAGLEPERKRIFILPDEIKSKIIPAHEKLLEKFRAMSRSISTLTKSQGQ